jgi:hypothetical protein
MMRSAGNRHRISGKVLFTGTCCALAGLAGPADRAALGFVLSAVGQPGTASRASDHLRSQICFGPFLLGGALLAVLAIG